MSSGRVMLQANDTRIYTIAPEDGAVGNVAITLPKEGGTVLTTNTAVPVDSVPTDGSSNPVASNGVFDALAAKQNTLTIDATPTNGSSNPVSSDGVFDALALKVDKFNYLTKTSAYTAVKNDFIYADTTTAFTVTLPSSPSANDEIGFLDLKGLFSTNNLTIARNGKNIMGLAEDMTVSTKNISFILIYTTTNEGWRIK